MAVDEDLPKRSLNDLESRLRRVSYAVTGSTKDEISNTESAASGAARLRALESKLQALASRSQVVAEVLDLQARRPDIFHAEMKATTTSMTPSILAQLLLSHAQPLQQLSAQLTSLQNHTIPESSHLAKIISLQSRMEAIQRKQDIQDARVAEMRGRSAEALQTWYQDGLMDMSEQWAGWEERLRDMEILVRRNEAAAKKEQGVV